MEKITIDYKKLCDVISRAGKTKQNFSFELGKSKGYICALKNNPNVPENMVNLMCILLGIEKEQIMTRNDQKAHDEKAEAVILKNIYAKLCEVESSVVKETSDDKVLLQITKTLAEMSENIEVITNKVRANTTQLEKVKDIVRASMEDEEQRAEKFLSEMLSGGEAEAEEIFKTADELCIKRSELMKAKKKLEVEIFPKGYGANKKVLWRV